MSSITIVFNRAGRQSAKPIMPPQADDFLSGEDYYDAIRNYKVEKLVSKPADKAVSPDLILTLAFSSEQGAGAAVRIIRLMDSLAPGSVCLEPA